MEQRLGAWGHDSDSLVGGEGKGDEFLLLQSAPHSFFFQSPRFQFFFSLSKHSFSFLLLSLGLSFLVFFSFLS